MEALEVGTIVRYHGSIRSYHGEYEIIGRTDPDYLRSVKGDAVANEYYPDGLAYELWPVGVEKKFGNRELSLYHVRPGSITVVGSDDGPDLVSTGD